MNTEKPTLKPGPNDIVLVRFAGIAQRFVVQDAYVIGDVVPVRFLENEGTLGSFILLDGIKFQNAAILGRYEAPRPKRRWWRRLCEK